MTGIAIAGKRTVVLPSWPCSTITFVFDGASIHAAASVHNSAAPQPTPLVTRRAMFVIILLS